MSLVLQVSDTHFGTEQPAVVEALLNFVQEYPPDLVVLSGDLTQRARRRQFHAAQHFIKRLGVANVLVIPGNHDIPLFNLVARFFYPYTNHRHAFGEELEPECELDDLLAIGVNTTRPSRHKDGEVSSAQINRVCQRLQHARDTQLRLVVTHQPVHVTSPKDETNLLHGHAEAVRAWAAAGADLILGGHIHLPYIRPLRERFSDLPRHPWIVQAGTAVSSRIRGGIPNSVNLIRVKPEKQLRCCAVERWDHNADVGRFTLVERHALRFGERHSSPQDTAALQP